VFPIFEDHFAVDNDELHAFGLLDQPWLLGRQVVHGLAVSTTDALWVKDYDIRSEAWLETSTLG
jgi:hypothetical protein